MPSKPRGLVIQPSSTQIQRAKVKGAESLEREIQVVRRALLAGTLSKHSPFYDWTIERFDEFVAAGKYG